jgi:hypothetical protein
MYSMQCDINIIFLQFIDYFYRKKVQKCMFARVYKHKMKKKKKYTHQQNDQTDMVK